MPHRARPGIHIPRRLRRRSRIDEIATRVQMTRRRLSVAVMDRIWQWAWDRYGPRYSWAMCAVYSPMLLLTWLFPSFFIVAFEKSDHYVEAAAVTVVAVPVLTYLFILPGLGRIRLAERWAAGDDVDRSTA